MWAERTRVPAPAPASIVHESMPANASFVLQISIRSDSGDPIAFKVDGERFEGGTRTLKFANDTRYHLSLTTKPATEFHALHVAGCDLQLHTDDVRSGQYTSDWNTTGMEVCKKGTRENVNFIMQGPGRYLKRQLQCKFYPKGDAHAEWGHKLNTLEWNCAVDETGNVTVSDENFK